MIDSTGFPHRQAVLGKGSDVGSAKDLPRLGGRREEGRRGAGRGPRHDRGVPYLAPREARWGDIEPERLFGQAEVAR